MSSPFIAEKQNIRVMSGNSVFFCGLCTMVVHVVYVQCLFYWATISSVAFVRWCYVFCTFNVFLLDSNIFFFCRCKMVILVLYVQCLFIGQQCLPLWPLYDGGTNFVHIHSLSFLGRGKIPRSGWSVQVLRRRSSDVILIDDDP